MTPVDIVLAAIVCFQQSGSQGSVCVTPKEVTAVYTASRTVVGACPPPQKGLCFFTYENTVILTRSGVGLVVEQSADEVAAALGIKPLRVPK